MAPYLQGSNLFPRVSKGVALAKHGRTSLNSSESEDQESLKALSIWCIK